MAPLTQSANSFSMPVPWRWWPIVVALGIGLQVTASVTLWAAHLVIPVAALLGSHYGRRGFVVVALAGLPLLLQWRYEALFGGGCLDLYLAALVVCRLAGSSWPQESTLQPPTTAEYLLALLLLPLSMGLHSADDGELSWRLVLVFDALLYLFVFLLGTMGLTRLRIGVMLAGFAIFGMVLELLQLPQDAQQLFGGSHAELPLLGYTELRPLWLEYGFDNAAHFFTALGWFYAGRQLFRLRTGDHASTPQWHQTWLPVLLVTLIGVGWQTNVYLAELITGNPPPQPFMLLGSFYALPCAALWAGLWLRWRGIGMVLALLVAFLLLDGLIQGGFDVLDMQLLLNSADIAAVAGFGMLGIGLRNRLLGTADVVWSWRWASYIVITAVLLPVLFSLESVLDILWMLISGIGAILLGKWLAALRKRYLGWLPAHDGWLALLWLFVLVLLVMRNMEVITQMAASIGEWIGAATASLRAGEGWYEPDGDEFMALLILAGGLVVFLSALHRFLRSAAFCRHEVDALIGLFKKGAKSAAATDAPETTKAAAAPGWFSVAGLVAATAVARNLVAVLLLAFVLVQVIPLIYPREGLRELFEGWFTPESEQLAGLAGDFAAEQAVVNPYLWQAAREAYAQLPGTVNERTGSFETDWYSNADTPDERRRISVDIGETLESYDLTVNVRLQKKGLFGWWVEQGSYWDPRVSEFVGINQYAEQQQIAENLLARARALAEAE